MLANVSSKNAAKPKVLVAMSGGVDSSVAAALLQDQGYQIIGCFMRLGTEDPSPAHQNESKAQTPLPPAKNLPLPLLSQPSASAPSSASAHQGCCSLNDAADARMVAALLNIPFYVLNFRADFNRIIQYFAAEYHAGRTPNPCVRCNDWLKFGKLQQYAQSVDADFIATGHYARILPHQGRATLCRAVDHSKDQSYVLFGASQERLNHMLLPLGGMHKSQVRQIARDRGLPVFDKPDSQEICFVPDNDYAGLIARLAPQQVRPGPILDPAGQVVGSHPGHQHFTIGQRRGLGVALGYPLYVVDKNADLNTITVGRREDLLASGLIADQVNWLAEPLPLPDHPEPSRVPPPPATGLSCQVKIRYNSAPVPARAWALPGEQLLLRFDSPQPAVTPGQAAVCYQDDRVLGGGWITSPLRTSAAPGPA